MRTGGSISGTVTNATTGQPISGATVDAMQNGNVVDTATADASGNYTFPELPPGTYTLVARATRFPSSTRENVHFIAGQNTVVNFRLSRLVCQIETVDGVGDAGRHASLALDSSGRPHISYYDMTPDDLKYAYYDGFTWQIEAGGRC
ncbi:MAG: carboxypeptidase-like regulatory domain-containing protein, partial [Anaerolineae bacterium]